MIEHPVALGIGIGVGVVVGATAAVLIYKHYQKSKTAVANGNTEIAKRLEQIEEKKREFATLVQEKHLVDTLTIGVLTDWFKENQNLYSNAPQMIISIPSEEKLKGLGYTDASLNPDTNMLQFFYDKDTGKVLKMRIVGFQNIESNLQAQLLDQDGMIIVTE